MIDDGLLVTINSDDPAYFGGYINANFIAVAQGCGLSEEELAQLARNSFKAALALSESEQDMHIEHVDQSFAEWAMTEQRRLGEGDNSVSLLG